MRHGIEQRGHRPLVTRGDLRHLARGEDTVVHAVVALGEEHVTADLAAEEDAVLAHLALEMRVTGLPHDGHAAVLADLVRQHLRGLDVEDDLGARMPPQQITREQDEDQVRLVPAAALVDHADAIGVAVPRQPEVGARLEDLLLQVDHVVGIFRIGQVIREAPVRVTMQLDDVAAEPAQQRRPVHARDAVAGVGHHFQRTLEPHDLGHDVEVIVARAARRQRARARGERAALDGVPQALDLLLGQRRGAGVHHLHAVVLDGVVAAGDVRAAVELPVRGGEIEDGRGDGPDVHDVEARRPRALDEAGCEPAGRLAVVLADGDRASPVAGDQGAVGASDEPEDLGIDVGADAAAHVIGAEDVGIEHALLSRAYHAVR
jgi:hypothetical protein